MELIQSACSVEQIGRCLPVMKELRPQIKEATFVSTIEAQQREGYHLTYLEVDQEIVCLAGYRVCHNLAWGRFLYIDDFVTSEKAWRRRHGTRLFLWILRLAKELDCRALSSSTRACSASGLTASMNGIRCALPAATIG